MYLASSIWVEELAKIGQNVKYFLPWDAEKKWIWHPYIKYGLSTGKNPYLDNNNHLHALQELGNQ